LQESFSRTRLVKDLNLPASTKVFLISDCQVAVQAALNPSRDNVLGGSTAFKELQSTPQIQNLAWAAMQHKMPSLKKWLG
jgi:hypothetical protein